MKNKTPFLSLLLLLSLGVFVACTAVSPEESLDSATEAETSSVTAIETQTDLPTETFLETQVPSVETQDSTETEDVTAPVTDAPLLSPNFTTELYSVTKIDGVCYLNFHDGNQIPDHNENMNYEVIGVYFDSFEKLREPFLTGNLSADTVAAIKQQFKKTEQGIVVLDIVNMGKPVLPADCTIDQLCWTGSSLSISVQSSNYGSWGTLFLETDVAYEELYTLIYTNSAGEDAVISETDSTFDGVPCKIYDITNASGHYRDIKIEMSRGNQTFHICMKYILDHDKDLFPESDEHPYSVSVFSESNGQKYFLQQYALKETPTLDWLTSFVLEPVSDESPATS